MVLEIGEHDSEVFLGPEALYVSKKSQCLIPVGRIDFVDTQW